MLVAPTSLKTWKEITTFFLDKPEAGFCEFKMTLRLSPNTRVGADPSHGKLHPRLLYM